MTNYTRIMALAAVFVLAAVGFVKATSDSNSPILGLLLMGDGLHNNDWGQQTNANLTKVENAIGGYTSYAVSGGTRYLSSSEAQYAQYSFTGSLGSDQLIGFPASVSRIFVIKTGSLSLNGHALTLNCGGGRSASLPFSGYFLVSCTSNNMDVLSSTTP